MLVAVILGNRLNDDGSMSQILLGRLQMALRINCAFSPDKIILSGGVANEKAGTSEAQVMYDYLVQNGIDENKLILEANSLSTKQNAQFSVPIAVAQGATEIMVCSSNYHISRKILNPIKLFEKELAKHPNIKLSAFCQD